ncbi:unnamed protein product, partial [Didymodactylos carnosus]
SLFTHALKQQFSRDRHLSSSPSEIVLRKRAAHGHTNSGRKLKIQKCEKVERREYLPAEEEQQMDDLLMFDEHINGMVEMLRTTNYDMSTVKQKFDFTYSHRRQMIMNNTLVKEILEYYPALTITSIFLREVNLRCDPYFSSVSEAVKKNFHKLSLTLSEQLTKTIGKENIDSDDLPFAVLEYIMKRFKQSKRLLINDTPVAVYPMIQTRMNDDDRLILDLSYDQDLPHVNFLCIDVDNKANVSLAQRFRIASV